MNDPRFKGAFDRGRYPKYGYYNKNRFNKLGPLAVLLSLYAASGYSEALGNEIIDWAAARARGDIPATDLSAGAIGKNLSDLGAPNPFVNWLVFEKLVE